MAKKKKNVKKYSPGGDVRRDAMGSSPMFDVTFPRPSPPPGSVMPGGSATGEVGRIKKSADRAGKYLSEAERAIGRGGGAGIPGGGFFGGIGNVLGQANDLTAALPGTGMKKGGKVKKKKAKKSYSTGGKARGVGRAVTKKVRPCKMVKMKGS